MTDARTTSSPLFLGLGTATMLVLFVALVVTNPYLCRRHTPLVRTLHDMQLALVGPRACPVAAPDDGTLPRLDPWGQPYWLDVSADGRIRAVSAGPDREPGTADDVGYPPR